MFRQFKPPGVYVQEVTIGPKPIEGVTTNTTAFLGETQKGPVTPTLITSWMQFKTVFGGNFGEDKFLPYAVEGFFLNGGVRCYIRKVCDNDYAAALLELEQIEEISLVYSPNAQATVGLTDLLFDHCERLRNRFVIIDSFKGQLPSNFDKPKRACSFATIYYPWIKVYESTTAKICTVPPGGHVGGVFARNDIERGVHKAPANLPVKGVVDLEFVISAAQQYNLNPQGINCIRAFSGRDILVWGARTLASDPERKYVNVQRLLIYLEQSINRSIKWVIFEPNNEKTWTKLKLATENFLYESWHNGMLMGTKPEQAYFVQCDRSTMTQNDIDNGRLIMQVGVAPVRPAEFIIFRVSQQLNNP